MQWIIEAVNAARRHAWAVVVAALVLAGAGLVYAAHHLSVDTDTNNLFAKSLPWRQAAIQENRNFPQFNGLIVAVVRAATPEEAAETAVALNAALKPRPRRCRPPTASVPKIGANTPSRSL